MDTPLLAALLACFVAVGAGLFVAISASRKDCTKNDEKDGSQE